MAIPWLQRELLYSQLLQGQGMHGIVFACTALLPAPLNSEPSRSCCDCHSTPRAPPHTALALTVLRPLASATGLGHDTMSAADIQDIRKGRSSSMEQQKLRFLSVLSV